MIALLSPAEAAQIWDELDAGGHDDIDIDAIRMWFEEHLSWIIPNSERQNLFKALSGRGDQMRISKGLWFRNMSDCSTFAEYKAPERKQKPPSLSLRKKNFPNQ